MGSNLLKGTFIGGSIAWIWTILSWTVLSWHCNVIQEFANANEVADVIRENSPHSGVYLLPNFCNRSTFSLPPDDLQKGPTLFASVRKYGFDLDTPIPYIVSFVIQCVGAFFVTVILMQARQLAYGSKVLMALFIGLTSGILGHLPSWNWWGFPFPFVFMEICDLAVAWFLAGLVIAACVKRKKPPTPSSHTHHPTQSNTKSLFD